MVFNNVPEIEEVNVQRYGRFTIVQVTDETGLEGVGLSRKSCEDVENADEGVEIATNRAVRALQKKRAGQRLNHPLYG